MMSVPGDKMRFGIFEDGKVGMCGEGRRIVRRCAGAVCEQNVVFSILGEKMGFGNVGGEKENSEVIRKRGL